MQLNTRIARVYVMLSLTSCLFIAVGAIQVRGDDIGVAPDEVSSNLTAVMADKPTLLWTFDEAAGDSSVTSVVPPSLPSSVVGGCRLGTKGPQSPTFPTFGAKNRALSLDGSGAFIRVPDPGAKSVLDFHQGDSITLESWINPSTIGEGQQIYIVGKGRTQNPGMRPDNQNFALRLRGLDGSGRLSFLFRSETDGSESRNNYHRWNSDLGVVPDGTWHHIAVVYTFGKPESIRAYVDGQESDGAWDIGGPTTAPPVVDDDELWIGSSLGGNASCSLQGGLDQVAIYRHAVPADRLRSRYVAKVVDLVEAELAAAEHVPDDRVLVELFDKTPDSQRWALPRPEPTLQFTQDAFGFVRAPNRYLKKGLLGDWSDTLMLRARSRLVVADEHEYELLLRYKSAAKLYVDGKLIAQTNQMSRAASGHEAVPPRPISSRRDVHALLPGMQERLVKVRLEPGEHVVRLDAVVGGKGVRLELGQLSVCFARAGEPMRLLTATNVSPIDVTEDAWREYVRTLTETMQTLDSKHRELASAEWRAFWQRRHQIARDVVAQQPAVDVPLVPAGIPVINAIDHFIGAELAKEQTVPAPLSEDLAFLRRVTLDTTGVVPTLDEIDTYLNDTASVRRANVIDRLLDDPRWADHWVGYWQDVLAENPGILKPKLNNTGPFRWWIHESFLDNKPMDQFVTELVLMEGSKYDGGPAGFAMATENDAPMAAKAHVLAQAFLGMDMKCARCHDAPYHPFKQKQLFNLAAMLNRKTTTLPKTSTVPTGEGDRKPLIEISLKPGQKIEPTWPFAHLATELSPQLLNDQRDHREQLAASITSPANQRFAQVMANRLWKRYIGLGLVEPVDDWESASHTGSHPELLDFLAQQFVLHDYDVKYLARLILNSHAYQREPHMVASGVDPHLFASPARRKMSAEQLVDSLFVVSGKLMRAEPLTLDPEGRRPSSTFLNLGAPTRAWQFTSLSNERDRPALALPAAQSVIDLLLAYGWRDARPNPVTVRDEVATMLQPLTLANGAVGRRAVTLSDDHAITELCLRDQPLEKLIQQVSLRILTRPPTAEETAMFRELLAAGYDQRVVVGQPVTHPQPVYNPVSWSNHLNAEATKIKNEMERAVREGDPPTKRLVADWRARMEDAVWSLVNSPEFGFLP